MKDFLSILTLGAAKKFAGGGTGGTTDYNQLTNRPKINNVTLAGNKTSSDLGLDDHAQMQHLDYASSGHTGFASAQDISNINAKIPAQATAQNQLADKGFVNSSIATNTANYISNNGQPFNSVAELEAYSGAVTNNDYAFVTGTDEHGNSYYDRYKATVTNATIWAKEYRLNNSSFTAAQWEAISSGITALLVTKLNNIESGAQVNVIEGVQVAGTDLVPGENKKVNIPIADPSTKGVFRTSPNESFCTVDNNGKLWSVVQTLAMYLSAPGAAFMSKGTFENVRNAGKATLDATLVPFVQYNLSSKSATFDMVLPATGTYQDTIEVIFTATTPFTPTVSGGTKLGDAIPTVEATKTYDFLFTWVGNGWLFNWLAW